MEIQRHGNDHLEVFLNAAEPEAQRKEIEALDIIISNWKEKCEESKQCTVFLQFESDQMKQEAEAKVQKLNSEHGDLMIRHEAAGLPLENDNEETALKKSHLRDLIMLASVDGQFDAQESKMIVEIGEKMGFSMAMVNSIYNECVLNPDQIEQVIPRSEEERKQHLTNLCQVILADGKIDDWESVLIFPMAVKMGFDANDVSKLLQEMAGTQ